MQVSMANQTIKVTGQILTIRNYLRLLKIDYIANQIVGN